MAEFKQAQQIVGINEGGYQNDPRDDGNYYKGKLIGTNWGISAPTLAQYLGKVPSVADMKNLSRKTAEEILRIHYWLANHLDRLSNQSVANLIYDGVVNQGVGGTRVLIEKAVRTIGGSLIYYKVFTYEGIKYLNRLNQKRLFDSVKNVRANKYKSSKKTYFIKSWLSRLDRFKYYANNTMSALWPFAAAFMGVLGLILILL